MSAETPEYAWIPDGSPERDWESAIEESAQDTGTAAFPSEKTAPLTMTDISCVDVYAISYHHEGRWKPGDETGTELRLYAVLELVDGRWASLEAWNDYTGWGCQDGSAVRIGVDRESVVRFGLTDGGRQALGLAEPGERTAVTPPTPENVAEMLTEGDNDYHDGNDWHPSLSANGNVVRIEIEPYATDYETKLPRVHFRAVVVPGTDTPIVLERPDASFLGLDFEGDAFDDPEETGWQVVPFSSTRMWPRATKDADSILFRGSGHITTDEARRFAAALAAIADAVDAAQAEQAGDGDV